MNEMGVEKGGMKSAVGENGRNSEKIYPGPVSSTIKTHMDWTRRELGTPAVEGKQLTAYAMKPPNYVSISIIYFYKIKYYKDML